MIQTLSKHLPHVKNKTSSDLTAINPFVRIRSEVDAARYSECRSDQSLVMSHGTHTQAEIVQRAIAAFRSEANASEIAELEDEQLAAGSSGLEWYGRTGKVFERWLASHSASGETRRALEQAIHAVRVIFGSAT